MPGEKVHEGNSVADPVAEAAAVLLEQGLQFGEPRGQLRALGLSDTQIDDVPDRTRAGCTRCDAQRFYSYRRDGEASGRLIAVIAAR